MISVVVPAYNEEAMIGRLLKALTEGVPDGAIEIVVVPNGCRDNTEKIARSFGAPVKVVVVEEGSKVKALNAGEAHVSSFPRFFIDADVLVSYATLASIAEQMRATAKPASSPRLKMDLSHSSMAVKAFYAVWMQMSFHKAGMVGCGVYGLSEEGRSRFGEFPDLIADDGYVRSLFVDEERALPPEGEGYVVVQGPATIGDLVKIKTRSRLGLAQLRRFAPQQTDQGLRKSRFFYKGVLKCPWLWPAAAVYLYVNLRSRARAAKQIGTIDQYEWERDDSARQTAAATN